MHPRGGSWIYERGGEKTCLYGRRHRCVPVTAGFRRSYCVLWSGYHLSCNEFPVPASFIETLPLVQGWFYQGQESLAAVRQAEGATVAEAFKAAELSRNSVEYKESTENRIIQLEWYLKNCSDCGERPNFRCRTP